jgi:outer membrane protein W
MGKRAERKLTREVKKAKKQAAIASVIHTGLDGGESFRNIANQIGMDFHIDKDQALGMVMKEHRLSVQNGG